MLPRFQAKCRATNCPIAFWRVFVPMLFLSLKSPVHAKEEHWLQNWFWGHVRMKDQAVWILDRCQGALDEKVALLLSCCAHALLWEPEDLLLCFCYFLPVQCCLCPLWIRCKWRMFELIMRLTSQQAYDRSSGTQLDRWIFSRFQVNGLWNSQSQQRRRIR